MAVVATVAARTSSSSSSSSDAADAVVDTSPQALTTLIAATGRVAELRSLLRIYTLSLRKRVTWAS